MRFDKNVDVEVKRACKEYVQWLKSIYQWMVILLLLMWHMHLQK